MLALALGLGRAEVQRQLAVGGLLPLLGGAGAGALHLLDGPRHALAPNSSSIFMRASWALALVPARASLSNSNSPRSLS